MRKSSMKLMLILALALSVFYAYSQSKVGTTIDSLDSKYLNWYNLNPEKDHIQGASVDRAYKELLAGRNSAGKIIVAVIDGGVDIYHPDLTGKIWTNPKEIEGNGIDDDKNGYMDDMHGWNFIGNAQGRNIEYENMEYVRIFRKLNPRFYNVSSDKNLNPADKLLYKQYKSCGDKYHSELDKYTNQRIAIADFEKRLIEKRRIISKTLEKDKFNLDDINKIDSRSQEVMNARGFLISIYHNGFDDKQLVEMKEHNNKYFDYYLNLEFEPRKLVNDNPDDFEDSNYGNNEVKGPRSQHGTFVSGIIAACRDNNIGTNGIANNAEIMVLRVVPDGDERDKDVAMAIRYAVDNGAKIINMSFGKYFSDHKKFVDDAIEYADKHNVLMIHSAGNDALNLDKSVHFPTNSLDDRSVAQNWITVGATSMEFNKNFCGVFSNYGKSSVDIFAPGVSIISLYPDNTYEKGNGTSFSGPVVTGVAALVWSNYPQLTSLQLKDILLNSCQKYPKSKIYLPKFTSGKKTKTRFSKLSATGGTIDAFHALQLAAESTSK